MKMISPVLLARGLRVPHLIGIYPMIFIEVRSVKKLMSVHFPHIRSNSFKKISDA